jgi:hypothetical protein
VKLVTIFVPRRPNIYLWILDGVGFAGAKCVAIGSRLDEGTRRVDTLRIVLIDRLASRRNIAFWTITIAIPSVYHSMPRVLRLRFRIQEVAKTSESTATAKTSAVAKL